jgi:hypothetical protein
MFPSVQHIKRGKEKSLSNPVMFFNPSLGGIVLYGCGCAFEKNVVCLMLMQTI